MSDKKISDLDGLIIAESDDILPIVDMTGIDKTKKISISNLMGSPGPIGALTPSSGKFTTLELSAGSIINEFSIDGTLAGNSDTAVPTEKAVKTYVANQPGPGHTIASHTDTSATGAELDILTDNSIADALHRHSELVASDGSPDPALSIDANGHAWMADGLIFYTDEVRARDSGGLYLRDDSGTLGIFVKDGGSVGIGTDTLTEKFEVSPDTDISAVIGKAHIGYMGSADYAGFSHVDTNGTTDYALSQGPLGQTLLNAASGQTISVRNNNAEIFFISSGGIGFTSTMAILIDEIRGQASGLRLEDDGGNLGIFIADGGAVSLQDGTSITEFSTDGTLADNSDNAVPTEKAVKTYVDANTDLLNDTTPQLGGDLDCNSHAINMGDQVLDQPKIRDYGEVVNILGSLVGDTTEIDLELGNVITATVDSTAQTFIFTNPPTSGTAGSFTLILTDGGSQTVDWPASVDWAGGEAPELTASGVDILTFMTIDAGTIWYGFTAGLDMS
jgi:hypothetical protein